MKFNNITKTTIGILVVGLLLYWHYFIPKNITDQCIQAKFKTYQSGKAVFQIETNHSNGHAVRMVFGDSTLKLDLEFDKEYCVFLHKSKVSKYAKIYKYGTNDQAFKENIDLQFLEGISCVDYEDIKGLKNLHSHDGNDFHDIWHINKTKTPMGNIFYFNNIKEPTKHTWAKVGSDTINVLSWVDKDFFIEFSKIATDTVHIAKIHDH